MLRPALSARTASRRPPWSSARPWYLHQACSAVQSTVAPAPPPLPNPLPAELPLEDALQGEDEDPAVRHHNFTSRAHTNTDPHPVTMAGCDSFMSEFCKQSNPGLNILRGKIFTIHFESFFVANVNGFHLVISLNCPCRTPPPPPSSPSLGITVRSLPGCSNTRTPT